MKTVILIGVASVVGGCMYKKSAKIKTNTVIQIVEVPKEVDKYIVVPFQVPILVEVIRYVNRPILVKSHMMYEDQPDWEQEMIDGVKFFEGYRQHCYYCSAGVKTIGYGCTDSEIVARGVISKQEATKLLLEELNRVKGMVEQSVTVSLTDNQLNALTSFTFNCGVSNLKTLINGDGRLNDGNYESVEEYLPQYRLSAGVPLKGLERRRAWEISLWLGDPVLP